MATDPLTITLAPGMAPAAPLMRLLASFDRQKVEAFAEISVALLDMYDAPEDPDEPAFQMQLDDGRPGDPDDREDGADAEGGAYVEWQTKASYLRRRGQSELLPGHEDDEDDDPGEEDDPSGQIDEDGVNTAQDTVRYTLGANGPGCMISDQGIGDMGGFYD